LTDDAPERGQPWAALERAWTVFWRLWRALEADLLFLRAAGMAYISLASLVPLLLLVVGILDFSGLLEQYSDALEGVVFRTVLGELPEVRDALLPGLRNADLTSLGILGVLGLVVVAGRLFMLIEDAYGATFGAPGTRTFLARILLLVGATFGSPVVVALVSAVVYDALSDVGATNANLSVAIFEFFVLLIALKVLPATRVRWVPAVLGALTSTGMLAACALAFQWYVAWFATGNPVRVFFGSMGVLPVFLLWLYLVWVSVLIGVEVAALVQFRRSVAHVIAAVDAEEGLPLDAALAVLGVLASERARGRMLVSDEEMAARLQLPPRISGALIRAWEERRVLVRSADGDLVLAVGDDVPLSGLARRWRHEQVEGSPALTAVREELDQRLRGTLGEAARRWRSQGTFSSEL